MDQELTLQDANYLNKEDKRTLALSSLGGALEFYDFVIYVFYAKIISDLFFPSTLSPFWAMLNTYGIFAAGYFFRPLGGVVMAHFGDLVGRKKLFSLSILLMALPTLFIGILPTFENIGYLAPLLLLLMRVVQGIAIGGEIPAAWTFVSEHVPERKIGLANGLLTAGLSLGILLGALMSLWISLNFSEGQIHDWAWRIPFIAGGIFGLVALYLRTYLKETPVFKAMQARKEISKEMPVKQVLKTHKTAVAIGMLFTWFLTGCVVVVILAMPNLLTGTFGFERAQTFEMQSAAIVMQMVGCILAGYFADRFGCGKVMMVGALAVALTAAVFYNSLGHAAHSTIFGLYMLLGLCSGTVGMVSSSMVKMFPAPVRFSGISFSYNLSYAIVGGMTLPLVHWLSQYSDIGAMYYIFALTILAFVTAFVFWNKFEKNRY
ncbi:MFS transporter permease [Acinetobacter pittii]|uniref:MFS transporter n=3 Tax=Acinetobacter calcoaceticus/baumannii complex TaxID=909768 RepID=A0A242U488_ACIPI|nr:MULTISPECIES: MFS transporter [Acinetobacter]EXS22243.1 sugar (and other) transporter family protein [Acinetobacter baumannii 573719]AVN19102.1 MHS family MFS transporter [Acinetobacter pittii]KRI16567.1 MFS transporter permease [Acinetobacter pittii]MBD2849518.1 MFS transporter [Acinetobacter baumannii]MBD3133675.1 MFS transporter [Acinetobacter baumannii]